ncbi:hypothetical protein P4O66_004558 [Electrophorus voltai]|uniref:Alkylated DNA repair protein AlkB homologue 8 N-terminal domain-containing protein n=1 Tax=Electrophorus voltai TaxID=2609070 RepID=A0AAD8ZNP2_9TELE|nr:hypothetical protein P4O66_004558 [Electrophorus voltai]
MVVDFRRARRDHSPLAIKGSSVEIVKNIKFLGVHTADNLTWTLNTSSITKRAPQRLYFLQKLREAHLPSSILTTFYRGTVESILSSCIITWFGNCTAFDHKTLQRIVRTAEKIIGVSLPSITNIYIMCCIRKATNIVKDPTHPSHELFTLLPSGRRPATKPVAGPGQVLRDVNSKVPETVYSLHCGSIDPQRWVSVVWSRGAVASSVERLWQYANCSGSMEAGSEEVVKSLTSFSKHFITTDVRATGR